MTDGVTNLRCRGLACQFVESLKLRNGFFVQEPLESAKGRNPIHHRGQPPPRVGQTESIHGVRRIEFARLKCSDEAGETQGGGARLCAAPCGPCLKFGSAGNHLACGQGCVGNESCRLRCDCGLTSLLRVSLPRGVERLCGLTTGVRQFQASLLGRIERCPQRGRPMFAGLTESRIHGVAERLRLEHLGVQSGAVGFHQ